MARTVSLDPPPRRSRWWQFWTWFTGPCVPVDNRVLFYKRDRAAFGFLSNFHPAAIVVDGERSATTEHYYQAQKSLDPDYRAAVRSAKTPGQAKRLGAGTKKGSWFHKNGQEPRPDWDSVKLDVMRLAVRTKFGQSRKLRKLLLATRTAELVEDSATDAFWGQGADGSGQNWLGRVLMEAREELAK